MAAGIFRRLSTIVSFIMSRIFVLYALVTIVFLFYMIKFEAYKDVCNSLIAQQQQQLNSIRQESAVLPVPIPVQLQQIEQQKDDVALATLVNSTAQQISRTNECGEDFNSIQNLPTKDEKVLSYIKCRHLFPPSTLPYNVDFLTERSPLEQVLQQIFKRTTKGFFLDIGAHDGQFRSNTLSLEIFMNWTGLLIESNPKVFPNLQQRNRKAWMGDMCVSPSTEITKMHFLSPKNDILKSDPVGSGHGKLLLPDDLNLLPRENFDDIGLVECFPLPSIMTALNVSHVNFLSLNVQGAELKVLRNLPHDKSLQIDIILLEHTYVPEGVAGIGSFMDENNYFVIYKTATHFIYALKL